MMGSSEKPSIILIVIDSLRADRLSCYGYERNTSPNIDRMANRGLLFENAIVSAPWTLPSHASLFTGLYPSEHGATDETLYLDTHVVTLAELLSESGYHTVAHTTDNEWLSEATNLMKGFTELHGPIEEETSWLRIFLRKVGARGRRRGSSTARAIERVKEYLARNNGADKPFFLLLTLMDVHMPYRPARRYLRFFGLDKVNPTELEYLQNNFRRYRTTPEILSGRQLHLLNSLYDASIATLDERLAELLDILDSKLERQNTILIITSDHGENLGEHDLLGHWLSLYDTLLRVPLIITYPSRFSKPATITAQVQQHDLFYTILDLIRYQGAKPRQEAVKSKSLLGNLEGDVPFPDYTFAEHAYPRMTLRHIRRFNPAFKNERLECAKQAIRTNRYKYISYGCGYEELFSLKSDPGETTNIIVEQKQVADMLKEKLDEVRATFRRGAASLAKPIDFEPEVAERLRGLGYLD